MTEHEISTVPSGKMDDHDGSLRRWHCSCGKTGGGIGTDAVVRRAGQAHADVAAGGYARRAEQAEAEVLRLTGENNRMRLELAALRVPTEWDEPSTEWTWGSKATDGPGTIIWCRVDEQEARKMVALYTARVQDGRRAAVLQREVSAWREADSASPDRMSE